MACKRVVIHYLDHFLRARNVCGYWGIVSTFATKWVCISGSMETFQAFAGAIVVLLRSRVCPLFTFRCVRLQFGHSFSRSTNQHLSSQANGSLLQCGTYGHMYGY